MIPTLFVVADQSEAHLYKVGGTKLNPTLEAIDQLEHPEAREHLDPTDSNTFLYVDNSGSVAEEERRFIRELIDRLRKAYGSALSRTVEREIIGDFTRQDERTLTKRFAEWTA